MTAPACQEGPACQAVVARPRHIAYFDWLRALGAVAIVLLHAVVACSVDEGASAVAPGLLAAEGVALVPLSRWAVPVFFMMSGALMLDPTREMGLRKVGRHIWRVAFVLLSIGFAFCLMESAYGAGTIGLSVVGEAVLDLLTGNSWGHLWYLYATLGLYVVTPPLRWVVGMAERGTAPMVEALVLVLWLLCCGAPTLAAAMESGLAVAPSWLGTPAAGASAVGGVATCCGWAFPVVYYLAGHVLFRAGGRIARGGAAWWVVMAVGACACVAMAWLEALGYPDFQLPELCLALPFGAAVFLLARDFLDVAVATPVGGGGHPAEGDGYHLAGGGGHPAIATLCGYSFGIYVIHPLFGHILLKLGVVTDAVASCGAGGVVALQLCIAALGLVGSMALTWTLRRWIPGFRGKV